MNIQNFFGAYKSRLKPLHSGTEFTLRVADQLSKLTYKGHPFKVGTIATAGHDTDVPTTWNDMPIGWEVKRARAFEAGGSKMKLENGKLVVHKDGIVKSLLGDRIVFGGAIPPFMLGPVSSWSDEQALQFRDERIPIESNSAAQYYAAKGDSYIIVEDRGVYHTGVDILGLGVPKFECPMSLRIRTSKHRKRVGDIFVPTDVVVDINYDVRALPLSPVDLFTRFPAE